MKFTASGDKRKLLEPKSAFIRCGRFLAEARGLLSPAGSNASSNFPMATRSVEYERVIDATVEPCGICNWPQSKYGARQPSPDSKTQRP